MSNQEANSYRNNNNSNIQYFIDHEKNIETLNRSSGDVRDATSNVRTPSDFRVLRCFCGCTALTHEQIEHFAMINVKGLIEHATGNVLFRNFLQLGHRTDKSEALITIECYVMCKEFSQNLNLIHDQNSVDQLLSLCPSYTWEQKLTNAFESGQQAKITDTLMSLQQDCIHSVECHVDYDRFRTELLAKIGKS